MLEILTNARKRKGIQTGKEEVKLLLFTVNEKVGNLRICNTTPRSDTPKIIEYRVRIYKSMILEIQLENEVKTILFTIA